MWVSVLKKRVGKRVEEISEKQKKSLKQKSIPKYKSLDERVYTAVLFPRAIDYPQGDLRSDSPYLKRVDVLERMTEERLKELFQTLDVYKKDMPGELMKEWNLLFGQRPFKRLSKVERYVADELCDNVLAYYNPKRDIIEIVRFSRINDRIVIPDESIFNNMAWLGYLQNGWPSEKNQSRAAETFRGRQEGLHNRIRIMNLVRRESFKPEISEKFTLRPRGKAGAVIIPYNG